MSLRLNLSLAALVCTFGVTESRAAAPETRYVQVQASKLRAAPQQWAKPTASLVFGDAVTVKSSDRGWINGVTAANAEGFIHESAVTYRKIVLKSIGASLDELTVNDTDVYLAGKGFNEDIERALAAKDTALDFKEVDKMSAAARAVDVRVESFVRDGGLNR